MLLTSNLAQPIVDKVMSIAQQNINIMDSRGVIIASGHKNRINTFHQGAQDVINSTQTVEIFPDDLDQYTGSLPGLNMPIILHGQVLGVVGISGHPDKVRDVARMVKMVTELILEQEVLQEEMRSQFQLRENFAALLLSDQVSFNHDKLVKTAKLLKYELHLPRLILVIEIQPLLSVASPRARESIIHLLSQPPHITPKDLVVFLEDRLVILKHFPSDTSQATCDKWVTALLTLLKTTTEESVKIGLGSVTTKYPQLGYSYQEALFALKNSTPLHPISTIHNFDILAAYLVEQISRTGSCHPIEVLKAKLTSGCTRKYDMSTTVTRLLENNMNITCTAKSLYIHRNTLLFRLEKLKEATGLNPCHSFNHALLCKIIFQDQNL